MIFAGYSDKGVKFTVDEQAAQRAADVSETMKKLFGDDCISQGVYMGRLGYGKSPASRSVRKSVAALELNSSSASRASEKVSS